MPWWVSLLELIGVPALKWALQIIEAKYPGTKPLIDEILKLINGGVSAQEIQDHLQKLK